jgi:hypothetical protein
LQFLQVHGLQWQPPDLQVQFLALSSLIGVTEIMGLLLLSKSGQKGY